MALASQSSTQLKHKPGEKHSPLLGCAGRNLALSKNYENPNYEVIFWSLLYTN